MVDALKYLDLSSELVERVLTHPDAASVEDLYRHVIFAVYCEGVD